MTKHLLFTTVLVCTLLRGVYGQQTPAQKMTNQDILSLASAGLSDDIIIAKIQAAPSTDFDTSAAGLKALQSASVSNAVVRCMINPHASAALPVVAAAPVSSSNQPDEAHPPGIYLFAANDHQLLELGRAIPKQTKGSGAFLSGLTYGVKKFKIRAVFDGANAPVKTSDPKPDFYFYSPEAPQAFGGTFLTPDSFSLLKLTQKDNTREIVEGSGSVWGTTTGADDNAKRGFSVDKLRPGIYKLTLLQPLAPGEYAFSQNAGSFFDFRITAPE